MNGPPSMVVGPAGKNMDGPAPNFSLNGLEHGMDFHEFSLAGIHEEVSARGLLAFSQIPSGLPLALLRLAETAGLRPLELRNRIPFGWPRGSLKREFNLELRTLGRKGGRNNVIVGLEPEEHFVFA